MRSNTRQLMKHIRICLSAERADKSRRLGDERYRTHHTQTPDQSTPSLLRLHVLHVLFLSKTLLHIYMQEHPESGVGRGEVVLGGGRVAILDRTF